MDLISVEATDFPEGPFEGVEFSVGSGIAIEPEGTKEARSGGWSFPTEGFACKKQNYTSRNIPVLIKLNWPKRLLKS